MSDSQISWTRAQRALAKKLNAPLVALGHYTHGKPMGTTVLFTAVDTYGIAGTIKRLILRLSGGGDHQTLPPEARENLASRLRDIAEQYRSEYAHEGAPHWADQAADHLELLAEELAIVVPPRG